MQFTRLRLWRYTGLNVETHREKQRSPTAAEEGRQHVEEHVAQLIPELVENNAALLCPLISMMFLVPLVVLGMYLKAWVVWLTFVVFSDEKCDQPLGIWLGSYLVYTLSAKHLQLFCTRYVCMYTPDINTLVPLRAKILHFCMAWFPVTLVVYGVQLVRDSKTCKKTKRLYGVKR